MKIQITAPTGLRAQVHAGGKSLQLGQGARPVAVVQVTQGLRGVPGTSGEAQISTDPGNLLRQGSDQRLYVPDGTYDFDGLVAATLIV